jgi:Bacterioferritin-associated ferredoxin
MIVCVCKSVSDRKIRASIAEGVDSFDELQFELGVAPAVASARIPCAAS